MKSLSQVAVPLLSMLIVPGVFVLAEEPDKSDSEKLQGTWQIISAVCNKGEEEDMKRIVGRNMTIAGDKFVLDGDGEKKHEGKIRLDTSEMPKKIDFMNEKEGTMEGIYALEGDELQLSFFEPNVKKRPTEFFSKEGDKQFLFVFKHVKPDSE